ncbi:phage adaptor protein [Achromobacter piechaudii]|uniref:Uncharacterized protein n=1 Tax=Achromobacter piechaudii TaxID=72556 RepID=A0ABM8L2R8_9BURK|nr:hypothetical protein [Achromobacter piechaudii]CAB3728846.1 hypothetical protein LMG1873_04619 [Achromobacter piechaudii]
MSFTNLDELVAAVGRWIKRKDLAPVVPDFITLFEARVNRVLRTSNQRKEAALAVLNNLAPMPEDWLEAITVDDGKDELRYMTSLQYGPSQSDSGFYAIEGSAIRVSGNTGTLNVRYYAKIPPLGVLNPTNWLLANHPDAYLFGVLTEAEPYLVNDARMALWKDRGDTAIQGIQMADDQARFAGGSLEITTPR